MKPINNKNKTSRRRGTAMFEMLLALPFIMVVLLFIWYFGRSSIHVQRNQGMTRYQAWREAGHGPGPTANIDQGHAQLNDAFHSDRATSISHDHSSNFPSTATDRWVQYALQIDAAAGQLASEMQEGMAAGRTVSMGTRHDTSNKLLEQFNGTVRDRHTVIDHDWKFVNGARLRGGAYEQTGPNASNLGPVRDAFYDDFDQELEGMADADNPFASTIRGLYLNNPGYRGPKVIN